MKIELPPPGLGGRITDPTSKGVPAAEVTWSGKGAPPPAVTDVNGAFVLGRPDDDEVRSLTIAANGFYPRLVAPNEIRDYLDLTLEPRPRLEGRVETEDGVVPAGAVVSLTVLTEASPGSLSAGEGDRWAASWNWIEMQKKGSTRSSFRVDVTVRCNEAGEFVAPLPYPGRVLAVVRHPDYAYSELELDFAGSGVKRELIRLVRGPLHGSHACVETERGEPVPGVVVYFQNDKIGLERVTYAHLLTDKSGRVPLDSLREGPVLVTVSQNPDGPRQPLLPLRPQQFVVNLAPNVVIRLR